MEGTTSSAAVTASVPKLPKIKIKFGLFNSTKETIRHVQSVQRENIRHIQHHVILHPLFPTTQRKVSNVSS